MLEVSYLTKKYGTIKALHNVSFKALHGQVLGILGPNGAGKSTLMKTITGYIAKSSGKVFVNGMDTDTEYSAIKRQIGFLPENNPISLNMIVEEFLEFSSDLKKIPKNEKKSGIEHVVELAGLTDVSRRLIRNLSTGYRQRVGIAQALIGEPELLILDEPTNGLDPTQIIEMRALIRDLGKNHTILYCSHVMSEVESICDRVIILNRGRVLAEGDPASFQLDTQQSKYQLTTCEKKEKIISALNAAAIEFTELELVNTSLESAFTRLIIEAEQEAEV